MFEVRVTISAPELAQAINNLAARTSSSAAGRTGSGSYSDAPAADAGLRSYKPYPGGAVCRNCPDRCAGCTAGWPDLCIPF